MKLDVLYEDNHCLAVNKPAGLLSQADATGEPSLVDLASAYLRARYHKPGNVFVGLLHRLDRPTSGVVLLARTTKGAARLSEQFRKGAIDKIYWAIVEDGPSENSGEYIDRLDKDRLANRTSVVADEGDGGKEARLVFRVAARWDPYVKLELRPATGRGHQLRVQLASRGFPILGDRKYGATSRVVALDGRARIALHARSLTFFHPTRGERITVEAPVALDWPELAPAWRSRFPPGGKSGS